MERQRNYESRPVGRISFLAVDQLWGDYPLIFRGFVPRKGLEPSHLAILVPKTSVSTNSTTAAIQYFLSLKRPKNYNSYPVLEINNPDYFDNAF